jgi:ATP-dependent Clp protease ATP-binding subunit ClpA
MFERFTDGGRQVVVLAREEARTLKHNYIGTEHMLLGLVRENEGIGARILLDFDADSDMVRNEVLRLLPREGIPTFGRYKISSNAPASLRAPVGLVAWLGELGPVLDQLGAEIRGELGRDPDIGDLLLVLACTHDTVPARALDELGIDLDGLWGAVEHVRAQGLQPQAPAREHLAEQITAVRAAKQQAIRDWIPIVPRPRGVSLG